MVQSTFWSEEHLASLSVLPDFAEVLKTLAEISCSHTELLQIISNLGLSFGKMSPESCLLTEDGILEPSSGCWQNAGMGSPTGFLTLSTSDFHNDAAVCSLSDILETGDVPRKYFLSPKACEGIIRRAEKRGKTLPSALLKALLEACAQVILREQGINM